MGGVPALEHRGLCHLTQEFADEPRITPAAVDDLTGTGKIVAGSRTDLAKIGMGLGVKVGAAGREAVLLGTTMAPCANVTEVGAAVERVLKDIEPRAAQ